MAIWARPLTQRRALCLVRLFGGGQVRSWLQRQPGMAGQPLTFRPHLERLLLHRRKDGGDFFHVEIGRDARIAGPLNRRRQFPVSNCSNVHANESLTNVRSHRCDGSCCGAHSGNVHRSRSDRTPEARFFPVGLARRPADIGQDMVARPPSPIGSRRISSPNRMLPASKMWVPRLCLTVFRLVAYSSLAQASKSGRISRTSARSVAAAIFGQPARSSIFGSFVPRVLMVQPIGLPSAIGSIR